MDKVKCNYHLKPDTKKTIDEIYSRTGISRSAVIDMLVKQYGTEILNIFTKGETQPVVCASTYTE